MGPKNDSARLTYLLRKHMDFNGFLLFEFSEVPSNSCICSLLYAKSLHSL